jgi:hypothetical protein
MAAVGRILGQLPTQLAYKITKALREAAYTPGLILAGTKDSARAIPLEDVPSFLAKHEGAWFVPIPT